MKVLVLAPYIYKKDWPEFTKNRTGFGMMVNDIFESISKKTNAYLLTQVITDGYGHVLKHTWWDVFAKAKIKDWIKALRYFFKYKQSFYNRIKYFYYALNSGSIRFAIKKIKPDIVHIHGIGVQEKPFIDVCEEEEIPYIVTLHGLIGLDDSVHTSLWNRALERSFLVDVEKKAIPVTVISTGVKRRIEENYLHHESKNITVICNGTRLLDREMSIALNDVNLKKEFKLNDEKIVVAIGSICKRKNQVQIVKALATGLVSKPCHVFFCGVDMCSGSVQKVVDDVGLSDRIHFLGFLSKDKIHQILGQADLNVVASKDEGFGLSIIEAAAHGVPSVTFSDIDAIPDLYNEECMICVDSRDDNSLALGIECGLTREWNKAYIRKFADSFSTEKMCEKYIDFYTCCEKKW